jgi:glycine cleavage system regulatory protein
MPIPMVFTFVGVDQPGLVEKLAHTVAAHGGNWLESRMSELAGQFAGIVKIEIPPEQADALRAALVNLSAHALSVVVVNAVGEEDASQFRHLDLRMVGNDRPGIVLEVSRALAARRISVRHMDTRISSAPMSGELLFEAVAHIRVPHTQDLDELNTQLDAIADALTIQIDLDASPAG